MRVRVGQLVQIFIMHALVLVAIEVSLAFVRRPFQWIIRASTRARIIVVDVETGEYALPSVQQPAGREHICVLHALELHS